jgi:hypothetical protein
MNSSLLQSWLELQQFPVKLFRRCGSLANSKAGDLFDRTLCSGLKAVLVTQRHIGGKTDFCVQTPSGWINVNCVICMKMKSDQNGSLLLNNADHL